MSVQARQDNVNLPFILSGDSFARENESIEKNTGRSTALAPYTVMAQTAANGKWVPLTSVDPTLTKGSMVTGALGTNAAGFAAVSDASFGIIVDGVTIAISAVDFTGLTLLSEAIDIINVAAAGKFTLVHELVGDTVTFYSPTVGIQSTVTVLTAGATGTDISGAGFLNGLTTVGTETAGTGNDGTNLPTGIYLGGSITAAEIVAADVEDRPILIGGLCTVDENQIVLENSLALSDVVVATQLTIRAQLGIAGIYAEDTINSTNLEN